MEMETLIGITVLTVAFAFLVSKYVTFETEERTTETERVEVRAATLEAALDHLDRLNASAFPNAREGSLQAERVDNAKLLAKVLKQTSPLLPTTVARVWVSSQLVAIVRIPNPNFAAA